MTMRPGFPASVTFADSGGVNQTYSAEFGFAFIFGKLCTRLGLEALYPQLTSGLAGKNAAGTLKIAAQVSDGSGRGGTDFFQGPLDSVGNVTPTTCANFGKIFGVTALEINTLRSTNGFNLADNVRGWPAKGNPFFSAIHGFTLPNQDLAPFVDLN